MSKAFLQRISDEISMDAIEKFSKRLRTQFKNTNNREAMRILQKELKKAREELNEDM